MAGDEVELICEVKRVEFVSRVRCGSMALKVNV